MKRERPWDRREIMYLPDDSLAERIVMLRKRTKDDQSTLAALVRERKRRNKQKGSGDEQ